MATPNTRMTTPTSGRLSSLPIFNRPAKTPEMPIGTIMLITGTPGSGKSTMAATARNPLALDFEKRLDYIDVNRLSPLYFPKVLNETTGLLEEMDMSSQTYPFNKKMWDDDLKGKRFAFLQDWMRQVWATLNSSAEELGIETLIFDTLDTLTDLALSAWIDDFGLDSDIRRTYKAMYGRLLPILQGFTDRLKLDQIYVVHVNEFQDPKGATKYVLSIPEKINEWFASHAQIIGMISDAEDVKTAGGEKRFYVNLSNSPVKDGTNMLNASMPTTMQAVYAHWTGANPETFRPEFRRVKTAPKSR